MRGLLHSEDNPAAGFQRRAEGSVQNCRPRCIGTVPDFDTYFDT